VKLLALAAGLACVLGIGTLVGPALSLSRYRADPVDFELTPGGSPASAQLHAPKRFNLVGLRWRGAGEPGILLRARKPSGRWGRWMRLAAPTGDNPDPGRGEPDTAYSEPAWVGEADAVQYRMSRHVRGLRLHFVNVEGTATAADRARTAIRRTVNTAVVSTGSLFGSHSAQAAGAQPAIVPRSGWGASNCPPRHAPDYGVVKAAYVHHTVNSNDYSREEAPDIVLAICRYHRNSNGWNDIGYNFLVDRYGTIYEGRAGGIDRPVVGAHAQGYNAQSTGIANIGTFTDVPQTSVALDAMARLIRWKLPISGSPTYGHTTLISAGGSSNRYPDGTHVRVLRIIGHRDTGETECPGTALYNQLPQLRSMVGNVAAIGSATTLSGRFRPRTLPYRSRSRVRGRLISSSGSPISGATVQIQIRRHGHWRTAALSTTDAQGLFRRVIRPRRIERARARFPGGGGILGAISRRTLLRVRVAVSLDAPPEVASPGAPVRLRGRVGPAGRRLVLVVRRRRHGRWGLVLTRELRARHGRFRTSFTPRHRGRYRYYVVGPGDRSLLKGRSATVTLRVSRSAGGALSPR
jgi:hypothetical protein